MAGLSNGLSVAARNVNIILLTGLPNDLCVATRNDMKYPKFGEGCQMV